MSSRKNPKIKEKIIQLCKEFNWEFEEYEGWLITLPPFTWISSDNDLYTFYPVLSLKGKFSLSLDWAEIEPRSFLGQMVNATIQDGDVNDVLSEVWCAIPKKEKKDLFNRMSMLNFVIRNGTLKNDR